MAETPTLTPAQVTLGSQPSFIITSSEDVTWEIFPKGTDEDWATVRGSSYIRPPVGRAPTLSEITPRSVRYTPWHENLDRTFPLTNSRFDGIIGRSKVDPSVFGLTIIVRLPPLT